MDKQPLNTGEQKDMTEFFTDLIGKIEEMSPALVRIVMCLLDLSGSGQCVKSVLSYCRWIRLSYVCF